MQRRTLLRRVRPGSCALLLISVALLGCAGEPATLPEALQGEWRTREPRYADRSVTFEAPATLRLGLGDEGEQSALIERFAERDSINGERRFELTYLDADGERCELDLALVANRGVLYVGANRAVAWRRAQSSP